MRFKAVCLFFLIAAILPAGIFSAAGDATVKELLERVGMKPEGDRRGQMDIVGFAATEAQMDRVMAQCRELASDRNKFLQESHGWKKETSFIAGVCPHDDYYYAGRLYTLLLSRIRAKRVILFGVFHRARVFQCRDRLVFDSYKTWHGPYGPVRVSPLRKEIIKKLPPADYVIDNNMHMVEHSVEAIVPFLQANNPDVEIIPILVPYMDWKTLDRLASDLSGALASLMAEKGWRLGRDVCLISSADAVHYGDAGWGGSNYAPFGTDVMGYQMAVQQDMALSEKFLCGPLQREMLEDFLWSCVDPEDVMKYRITWCGRFSVPFGLDVASRLTQMLEERTLTGTLLDYGTSVSEASLNVEGLDGLGPTAPNNFHHFVGYVSIGYR